MGAPVYRDTVLAKRIRSTQQLIFKSIERQHQCVPSEKWIEFRVAGKKPREKSVEIEREFGVVEMFFLHFGQCKVFNQK